MPSVFESVTSLLGKGDSLSKMASLIGGDNKQAKTAVDAATPAILNGLADKAAQPGGSDAIMEMLNSDNGSTLGNLAGFLDGGNTSAGNGILDNVFGGERADLVSTLASKTGLSGGMVGKLLPMLAPIVMGAVGKRRSDDRLDAKGLTSLLETEKVSMEQSGLLGGLMSSTTGKVGAGAAVGAAALGAKGMAGKAGDIGKGSVGKVGDVGKGAAGKVGNVASGAAGKAGDVGKGSLGKAGDIGKGSLGKAGDVGKGSLGKAGDVGKGAAGKVGKVGKGSVGKVGDVGKGSVGKVGDVGKGSVGKVGDVGKGSVGKVGNVGKGAAGKVGDVGKGTIGKAGSVGDIGAGGGGRGIAGWLPWAIGAIALVLLLAWLLSNCNGGDADVDATAPATTAQTEETEAEAEVEEEETETTEAPATTAAPADAGIQPDVDAALGGTGVTGVADGGVVTLTGTVDTEEAKAEAEANVTALDGVESVNNEIVVEAAEEPAEDTTINDELDLDPITFNVNSDQITAEGQTVLDQAAEYLTENDTVNVEIAGHTDSDGEDASNLDLSQRRSESVKTYLEGKGIAGDRMTPKGYGEAEPKVDNDTAENKAINRRIEFRIQ